MILVTLQHDHMPEKQKEKEKKMSGSYGTNWHSSRITVA
jgi:hypothetical protein